MKRRELLAAAGLTGIGLAVGSGLNRAVADPRTGLRWTGAPVGLAASWLTSVDSRRGTTWAVGHHLLDGWQDTRPLTLRRVGRRWVATPNPVQTYAMLEQVAIAGPNDVWTVGVDYTEPERPMPLALRWTRNAWRVIEPPTVPTGAFGEVKIAPDGSVWVAGWAEIDGRERGVVYQYVDGRWDLIADGLEQTINGNALLVLSATDAWLAANPGLAHFDGKSWTFTDDIPADGSKILTGFAAAGPDDLWAVGVDHNHPGERAYVIHYDGSAWTSVDVPEESGQLYEVEVWNGRAVAVGERFVYQPDGRIDFKPYVLQQQAKGFVAVKPPAVPDESNGGLTGLAAGRSRLWTVGGVDEAAFAAFSD